MARIVGEHSTPFAAEVSRGVFLISASSFLLYLIILQSNKSLIENKNQYKRLFEENPNPMWVYELETLKVLAVNQAALQVYGYTQEEFLNMTLLQLRPGSEHEKLLNNVRQESPTYSNSGTWLHMRKNGEVFFVSIFSHRTHFNGKRARLVLALDINDKLVAEKRILAQNDKLREIAHMQSHNVRRPVASILGLINLFDKRNPANEMNGIVIEKLDVVCKELDQTIHQIVEKTYELEVENQQSPQ
ncbi:PAS domain S-box protein [Cesiribacter sp. SM1]|uniref:PAS domain S-box protein n=1 Tax=Cesiribacter sp. SM1 TaxID=2861196 RepID=UPI001CD5FEB1|nr:PAS domain S-box protein [Cesiribacter sp. SM1]